MPATKTDIVIEQGTDWSTGWAVTVNGAPIDETWDARGQIRSKASSSVVLHQFVASVDEDGNVTIAVTPDDSTVVRDVDGALVSGWTWSSGVYDVEIVNADESITLRVAEGSVKVKPEVTR